jgi:hypothetical protein
MHHEGLVADEDALGAGVKVDAVVQVDVAAEVDVGRLAQADVIPTTGKPSLRRSSR